MMVPMVMIMMTMMMLMVIMIKKKHGDGNNDHYVGDFDGMMTATMTRKVCTFLEILSDMKYF